MSTTCEEQHLRVDATGLRDAWRCRRDSEYLCRCNLRLCRRHLEQHLSDEPEALSAILSADSVPLGIYVIRTLDPVDYDMYDSAVVVAFDEEDARMMNPGLGGLHTAEDWVREGSNRCWAATPDRVEVARIGEASPGQKRGFVVSSFNAG